MPARLRFIRLFFSFLWLVIIARLFFWQVINQSRLRAEAQAQYQSTKITHGKRGLMYTADGYLLVGNQQVFRLFARPTELDQPPEKAAKLLAPLVATQDLSWAVASTAADQEVVVKAWQDRLQQKLSERENKWVSLVGKVDETTKNAVMDLKIKGLGAEGFEVRTYPESSMAAYVTGFVGKDDQGTDTGYFGLEGALDKELRSRAERRIVEKDGLGLQFLSAAGTSDQPLGRSVVLTIRRDVQHLTEQMVKLGVEKYGAKSAEIIIMKPSTGQILGMAAWPHYDPANFFQFPPESYKNPSVSNGFEPGSIFKTLTVAAGVDAGVITPDTICTNCAGPREIGKYTIKTWNNEYHPNITMSDALAKSDNTAMIFITDQLGKDTFEQYIKNFGIGEKTYVDLQEDTSPPFPQKWGPVETATISFGQGISTTSLQMVKAVGAIANDGKLMRPQLVSKVIDANTGEEIAVEPVMERQVIKSESAQTVAKMMVHAASEGEAKWTATKSRKVAAKTGTAQVSVNGEYDPTKTIASFIGFAPADNPQFVMLVKLQEPTTSPWAAETAAPLWYATAEKLYLLLNIPPQQ